MNNTIYVRVMGGLGNQMFQYATARALADRTKSKLVLDKTWFKRGVLKRDTNRPYELDCFNVRFSEITFHEYLAMLIFVSIYRLSNKLYRFMRRFLPNIEYVLEKDFSFDNAVYNSTGSVYLDGYWQSEKYYLDNKEALLTDLDMCKVSSNAAAPWIEKITTSNSVSVHIRRGDYITNKSANKFHGTCSMEYYNNAINKITSNYNNIKFYIFSDDIAWCKENFKHIKDAYYVDDKKLSDVDEMAMMSLCKHNVIANSSFSWWSAWLNPNPHKIVIAPKKWFASGVKIPDLLPDEWIKL